MVLVEALQGHMVLSHVPRLSTVTRKALSSPLAANYCQRIWNKMAHSVFKDWTLGKSPVWIASSDTV